MLPEAFAPLGNDGDASGRNRAKPLVQTCKVEQTCKTCKAERRRRRAEEGAGRAGRCAGQSRSKPIDGRDAGSEGMTSGHIQARGVWEPLAGPPAHPRPLCVQKPLLRTILSRSVRIREDR